MKYKRYNKGFTLVELMVGITIFVVVISIVVSLFMMGIKGQRNLITIQTIQDNARYLLEFIAKEIRMSVVDNSTAETLNITRSDGESVTYSFINQRIDRLTSSPSTSGSLNSDQVLIDGRFYTMGVGRSDGQQPRVTIVLKVKITDDKAEKESEVNLQTTVCPRNLEI